jgi:hypothetical protein
VAKSLRITCPTCGEDFDLLLDPSEGDAEFISDCEICCRPMTVTVRVHGGDIETLDVSSA